MLAAAMVASAASFAPTADAAGGTSAASASTDSVARQLNLSADEALQAKSVYADRDGSRFTHYNRTFRGLRVVGGDLIVATAPNGTVRKVTKNGTGKVAVTSTTPTLAKATALAKGRSVSKAKTVSSVGGTLVIYAGAGQPRLAYEVQTTGVQANQTPSRLLTYVDARTGAVLASDEQVKAGTGKGIFVGQVSIGTSGSAGAYTMKDAQGNYTTDLKGATSGTGTTFTDADDVWGNGTNSDRASAGVDAHYGAEQTYSYYNSVQGRAGIWNNGTGARSRVHYGNNYANAFWDGTQMTYGDGANNANPLVELDVAGHEMSHGVTENTAGLVYSGDPGGLNEATSDIFGTAVEWYANNPNDVPDYLIGEELNLNGNGTPLRYMDKPSKDGASYDCWSSSVGSANPHYSSGPLNHWFYLASEGSGAKTINGVSYNSPTCNGKSMTGAGRRDIEKVWYRTLATKLTSNSTYKDAREGAINSAIELFGASSTQCLAVQNAFDAISVPAGTAACSGGGTPPPSGSSLTNGGFESGQTGWTGTSGPITNDTGRPAHSGSWKLWLGGNGATANESESQTFTVPATGGTLTWWVRIDTAETSTSSAYDTATVSLNGTTVKSYSNLSTPKSTWVQQSVSLSSYAGSSVTLKFAATEDSSLQTSFVIDDVAVS
ncbi:M4 family metallopeptidase [Calidifontibacter sp. DB0510]|uniref:Neutral metalloproteinase n=2 Tax=Metallococcus carri TaxID=1656884 RepID=A0A967EDC4_9MICO|nr:M4 family metallopeptidase [Metallococcus carri]NOP36575.1 M4 family metallopeptidase [Calidifontibacter sp. DB2511S]